MSQPQCIACHKYDMREDTMGVFMVFMYIFSFYVLGPITSSIVASVLTLPACMRNHTSRQFTYQVFECRFFRNVIGFILILMCLCVFYSTIHLTHDLSYLKTLFGQLIQLISGAIIVSYLFIKCNVNIEKIICWIIIAYLIQSIIELIAVSVPAIASALDYFNHAGQDQENSGGVRGMALASGTTWSLGLTYGAVFILYFGCILSEKINLKTTAGLMLLVIGTIFAGRTGFVGAVIGGIFFILFGKQNIFQKSMLLVYILIIVLCMVTIVYLIVPQFIEYMIFNVMPWAFEPIFSYIDGGVVSTKSTDVLDDMWNEIPTFEEAICGVGLFTGADGKYYRHTDVGILRNLFYWGIGGYAVLVSYQLYLLWPMFKLRNYRLLWIFLLVFLLACEYKAMTLGFNKQSVSLIFLISFIAYYYPKYWKCKA